LDNKAREGAAGDSAEKNASGVDGKAFASVMEEEDFDDDVRPNWGGNSLTS
jgi:hypothetical protein